MGTEVHSGFADKSPTVDSHHFCPEFMETAFSLPHGPRGGSHVSVSWGGAAIMITAHPQRSSFTKLKCQISEFALDVSYVMCALLWAMLICFYFTSVLPFCLLVCVCLLHGSQRGRDFMETWGKMKPKSYETQWRSLIIYNSSLWSLAVSPALEVHEIPLCRYDKFSFRVS